jgi:SAM-dependent methyltransferase
VALRDWLERRAGGPAELYDGVMARLDAGVLAAPRRRLAQGLGGAVLELGCGTGAGFAAYPAGASVTALEPDPAFRRAAARAAREAAARIEVRAGDARRLPFPDASFDAVLGALVLCSVDPPGGALAEAYRVLRPGGRLRLLEHVRHPRWGHLQDATDPLWTAVEGRGCHLGRDTPAAVEAAGFLLERATEIPLPPVASWFFPLLLLEARRPARA